MHKPPRIQVQFLIEPPDAPIAEYNRPLPKFIYFGDMINGLLHLALTFLAIIFFVLLTIIGSALGRIHR